MIREHALYFTSALGLIGPVSLFGVLFVPAVQAEPTATPVGLSSTPSMRQFSGRSIETLSPEQRIRHESFRLNEQGVEFVLQGKHADGVAKIRQALSIDPNNSTALFNLSGLLLIEGKAEEAVTTMQRAVALKADDLSFLNRLAEAHVANSNVDSAIATYEKIQKINPRYEQTLTRLGSLYGMKQDWNKAETTLREAVRLNPNDGRAWGNLGSVLYMSKKYADAVQAFESANRLSETADNRVGLGLVYSELGNYRAALENLEKGKSLGSTDGNLNSQIQEVQQKLEASATKMTP